MKETPKEYIFVKAYLKLPTFIPYNLLFRAASLDACCLKTVTCMRIQKKEKH